MKHIIDAKLALFNGNTLLANQIIDEILDIAPKNPEALKIRADIFDSCGRFSEAFNLYNKIEKEYDTNNFPDNTFININIIEEKYTMIFSELTIDGRKYFSFPVGQFICSIIGLFGCVSYLYLSEKWTANPSQYFTQIFISFIFLVCLPWAGLIYTYISKIKDISVGIKGIIINKALKKDFIIWSNISYVVIEYDDNYNIDYLKLYIYDEKLKLRKIFDISVKKSVVKARRHFVTNILTHVDIVLYKNKNQEITKQMINIIKTKQYNEEDIEFSKEQTKVA